MSKSERPLSYTPKNAQIDADLAPIRTQIDAVDAQLLTLLNERAKLAQQVGEVKQKYDQRCIAQSENPPVGKIAQRNPGPLCPRHNCKPSGVKGQRACRAMESRSRSRLPRPCGPYTEQAMFKQFGHAIVGVDCDHRRYFPRG